MKNIRQFNLHTKALLREIIEINKNDFPVEMKVVKSKFPERFSKYSANSKTVSAELFVAICEHFGLSHQRILEKIVGYCNVTEKTEEIRIVNWLGLKLPKTDEELIRNFGRKDT